MPQPHCRSYGKSHASKQKFMLNLCYIALQIKAVIIGGIWSEVIIDTLQLLFWGMHVQCATMIMHAYTAEST